MFGHLSVNVQIIVVMALTTELIAAKSLFQAFIDFIFYHLQPSSHQDGCNIVYTHTHGRFWGFIPLITPLPFHLIVIVVYRQPRNNYIGKTIDVSFGDGSLRRWDISM